MSELPGRLPRLRAGPLWIADRWPDVANALPFAGFLERLFSDVRALLVVEKAIGGQLPDLASRSGVRDLLDEDSLVVGTGRDGCLAPGFVDIDEKFRSMAAYLRDGAFMDARPHDKSSPIDPMYKVPAKALVPIDVIDTLLDDSRPALRSALEVLKRIAEE